MTGRKEEGATAETRTRLRFALVERVWRILAVLEPMSPTIPITSLHISFETLARYLLSLDTSSMTVPYSVSLSIAIIFGELINFVDLILQTAPVLTSSGDMMQGSNCKLLHSMTQIRITSNFLAPLRSTYSMIQGY